MITKKLNKIITSFKPMLLSRHPSHQVLRNTLGVNNFRCIIRLGSTTTKEQAYRNRGLSAQQLANIKEINTVQGVKNSSSKLLMKQCFTRVNVKTAEWTSGLQNNEITRWARDKYPIIAKSHYGSRGEGNTKIDTPTQLETFVRNHNISEYIFEKYQPYSKEYRIHVTSNGCFYTCRKLLRNNTPENEQWQRHDDNCVWIVEDNPKFMKPDNWNVIVQDCIRAKNALGLDVCAFDVKVQGTNDRRGRARTNPEYIIIESCSAPSFGDITVQKYIIELKRLILEKYNNRNS